MAHDSSLTSSHSDINVNVKSYPKNATLSFIRQFARTCVSVQAGALGSMILN